MRRALPHLLMLLLATLSTAGVLIPHLLGWRPQVEALTGNLLDPGRALQGAVYAVAWLQWVILAPIFTGGGLLGLAWELLAARRRRPR